MESRSMETKLRIKELVYEWVFEVKISYIF